MYRGYRAGAKALGIDWAQAYEIFSPAAYQKDYPNETRVTKDKVIKKINKLIRELKKK